MRLGHLAGLGAIASACVNASDPAQYPYRFEVEAGLDRGSRPVDLDGDRVDEVYSIFTPSNHHSMGVEALMLSTLSRGLKEQINFDGRLRPPLFRDVAGDDALELLIPTVRNDSLFLSVADAQGRKLYGVFLTAGAARVEPEGVLPWDPDVVDAHVGDVDGDGQLDLTTVVRTGFARVPRGVFLHRIPDGALLGSALVGATIRSSVIDDFDGDGRPEVFAITQVTNNGGRAGGFDDSQALYLLFEIAPTPRVTWHARVPEPANIGSLTYSDFDGDGRREILVAWSGPAGGRLELLDTRTWERDRVREIPGVHTYLSAFVDVDRDGRLEIIMPGISGEVLLFDDDFTLLRRANLHRSLTIASSLPDLDGDGVEEIVITTDSGFVMLGPALQPRAMMEHGVPQGIMRPGVHQTPRIVVHTSGRAVAVTLRRNRWYVLYRYGPSTAAASAVALVVIGGIGVNRARRRRRLIDSLHSKLWENERTGFLVIDRMSRVLWMNETFRRSAGLNGTRAPGPAAEILSAAPAVHEFCEECLALPTPKPHTRAELFQPEQEECARRLAAEPLYAGLSTDPHWLVTVTPVENDELSSAGTSLARRVVHDLRNPLTSIRLTLQRMQVEYREASPDVADRLDVYSERLQERIDHLRRLTTNFLKILGDEKSQMESYDVNAIVSAKADVIRLGLPPDIVLKVRLATDLPALLVDREQLESVLENLVANAVNAMPHGGVVTFSTSLTRGELAGRAWACAEFVAIEVLDCGTGIPSADLGRVFEPGFTTTRGSGLGLPIVRRIVRDHGGDLVIESEVGTGTAVSILLPIPGGCGVAEG